MIRRLVVALVVCLMFVPSVALAIIQYPNPVLYSQVEGDPDQPGDFTDSAGRFVEQDFEVASAAPGTSEVLLALAWVLQYAGRVVLP